MKVQFCFGFGKSSFWSGLLVLGILTTVGCSSSETDSLTSARPEPQLKLPDVPESKYQFAPGEMLLAGGEPIAVDSPGYACPTIADVDGDGVDDLVVGQFRSGKMHYCRNVASAGDVPKYADRQWIKTGDKPAKVPGVS